ncbi:MAG: hypothetical protein ROZ64_07985 [Burkholderiaceae bacterium]|nr:hypothetical protein [Burkholderiaceae bacterium]
MTSERDGQGAARFEQATAAAVRAIAGRGKITVSFGERPNTDDDAGARVCLPAPSAQPGTSEIARLRGEADSAALRLRYHDAELHRAGRPANEAAGAVFDALERARFEALGTRNLPGVAANLAARLDAECLAQGFAEAVDADEVPESTAYALLVRREAVGKSWPATADRVMQVWLHRIGPQMRGAVRQLVRSLARQDAYAAGTRRLLEAAGFECDESGNEETASTSKNSEAGDAGDADSGASAKERAPLDASRAPSPASPAQTMAQAAPSSSSPTAPQAAVDPDGREEPVGIPGPLPYRVFTSEYDAIVTPEDLCHPRQLLHWRARLDRETADYRPGMVRLAARLQQRLLARQNEGWDFEREEGILDAERVAAAIADPSASTVYKALRKSDFPDTTLSILIDNSGSMRGLPIRLAAMCADIVALALERCAVKVEILGFTTREWRGGRSRDRWISNGKPPNPGRLNDLCHIVYKSASTPWRRARSGIGILLDEGLLKENVDGEALLWAYRRLLMRAEQRRILLVLSDGAPADESTSSANPPGYLEQHLRQVIARIERERAVELAAIGLGHDVRRYYRRAVKLDDPRDLGETIIRSLDALLG